MYRCVIFFYSERLYYCLLFEIYTYINGIIMPLMATFESCVYFFEIYTYINGSIMPLMASFESCERL